MFILRSLIALIISPASTDLSTKNDISLDTEGYLEIFQN